MSQPLWSKGKHADAAIHRYTARDDHRLDVVLLPYDLLASKAHVRALARIGALDAGERDRIVDALDELARRVRRGEFTIDPALEDGHTAIEHELVAQLGEAGKRVHLGRSRNDQVLVALRLYERDVLGRLSAACARSAAALLALARAHVETVLPGYTHLQRAVPHTLGHWAAGFGEGFVDAAQALDRARAQVDKSPLGAAAGYGVNLPLDREGAAHELGFADVDVNPLWSQTSRGLSEVVVLAAVFHALAVVRRLAWDLSLFASAEFGFVALPEEFTTGSSIMPNKRNPDVVELMRASCSVVQGALGELMSLTALPSGYHRDLQLTKAPLMRAFDEAELTLELVPRLVEHLRFDTARMAAAVTADTLATDRAVDLARAGVPFREAYKRVGAAIGPADEPAGPRALESVRARVSLGAPGQLALDRLEARLALLEEASGGVRSARGDSSPPLDEEDEGGPP